MPGRLFQRENPDSFDFIVPLDHILDYTFCEPDRYHKAYTRIIYSEALPDAPNGDNNIYSFPISNSNISNISKPVPGDFTKRAIG